MVARRPPSRLATVYQARIRAIHAAVEVRIRALYGDVDPDAIDESIAQFIDRAEPVIAGGQASIATLVNAYIATAGGELADAAGLEEIVGTTRDGAPLATGMAAFGPMILAQVGEGRPIDEAMAFGQYLATRFADSEVTSAADREIDRQSAAIEVAVGWEGIVAPDACDACRDNIGRHELDEEIYRHPRCNCQRLPVFR